MNALGASVLAVLLAMAWLAPRRWALLSMLLGVLYLTQQQSLDVGGFNLTAIRLLALGAFIRVVVRGEYKDIRWSGIDRGLVLLYVYTTAVFLIRSDRRQGETVGTAVDVMLCYFSFRALLVDIASLQWLLRALALALIPYVALLTIEMFSGTNAFQLLGALTRDDLRDGRIRAMGSFRNPSLLGAFGACLLPLYLAQMGQRGMRLMAGTGILACVAIVLLSNSGGPVSGAAISVVGWLFWRLRHNMSLVRRSMAAAVAVIALAMNAPVWYLLERISGISGGSGWHRAHLLEMASRDLGQWWLAGMPLEQTRDWFPYVLGLTGVADITNAFVEFGLKAGIGAIALFVLLLIKAYSAIGTAMHAEPQRPMPELLALWALGCALAVHIATWLGITYFDQIYVVWLMQLAAIASLTQQRGIGLAGAGGSRPSPSRSPAAATRHPQATHTHMPKPAQFTEQHRRRA